MTGFEDQKKAARAAAFARRKAAFATADGRGAARLTDVLAAYRGRPLAGYMPIRTEIDPRPAMALAAQHGMVGVPVITGMGQPLIFAEWTPKTVMIDGKFGAQVPEDRSYFEPEVLIVPLVAFSRAGGRLGYGGGFYDRTLEGLREKRPTVAVGYAFAAQETRDLPQEPTDQPLDLIVTEAEVIEVG